MAIPTQAEYEARERAQFRQQLADVDRQSLSNRQAARDEWSAAMITTPALVAERISWLLSGSYGRGSYTAALDVMAAPRMNHAAWLGQTIAALEWNCPPAFARQAYVKLTAAQRAKLDTAIADIIAEWRTEQAESVEP
jgi:hypothetical protein